MADNPVRWFEIYVQDMARARAFYESVFELSITKLDNPGKPELDYWTFPQANMEKMGSTGALVRMPGGPAGGSGTIVYFGCADCGVTAERAVKAGGRLHTAKLSIGPHGFMALVYDTEGNVIGLHSMK